MLTDPIRASTLLDERSALLRLGRQRGLGDDELRRLAHTSWDLIGLKGELDHLIKRHGLLAPARLRRRRVA